MAMGMGISGAKLRAGGAEREWLRSLVEAVASAFPKARTVPWALNSRLSRAAGRCVKGRAQADPRTVVLPAKYPSAPGDPCLIEINEDYLCRCYRREALGQSLPGLAAPGGLMSTLVHEAAHLLHFNHGPFFRMAEGDIGRAVRELLASPAAPEALAVARAARAKKPAAPRQGELGLL